MMSGLPLWLISASATPGQPRPPPGFATIHLSLPSAPDRKSTRLNSSHSQISYAVFCLKKKNHADGDIQRPGASDVGAERGYVPELKVDIRSTIRLCVRMGFAAKLVSGRDTRRHCLESW